MKEKYEVLEVSVVKFEAEDVISTSGFSATKEMNQILFGDLFTRGQ